MALTSRPSKNINLAKIDDIQNEFFGEEKTSKADLAAKNEINVSGQKPKSKNQSPKNDLTTENVKNTEAAVGVNFKKPAKTFIEELKQKTGEIDDFSTKPKPDKFESNFEQNQTETAGQGSIADLLSSAEIGGVRHTSRPFVVPRSLTIDLTRLKSKFRSRNLQYTQNEIMDKMVKESLEIVTAENYFALREKALKLIKSPEQSSRRSVTLTEETVAGMAELKADLSLTHARRFSSDEIFTTLLAIAFAPLYENGLL